jgi:type III secretory pathway component EscV
MILVLLMILIAGGALTARNASAPNANPLPGLIHSTNNPEASVMEMTGWQAEQFLLAVGFILVNLVGIAVTITVVMWLLDRQVRRAKAEGRSTMTESGDA